MENAIEVKGLEKSYKKLHVLKGMDFEARRGSIFALLGSNGAGKTTIIRILTTLLKQDSGTATVNGFDVEAKPDGVRCSISLTGQFTAVDGMLTGRENLHMIAKLRHLDDPSGIAEALLEVWETVTELASGGTTVFLTTQYLEEAEKLADRIAILHKGRIVADATLTELKKRLPPATIEYVEKQPTLEEIFLHLTGREAGTTEDR